MHDLKLIVSKAQRGDQEAFHIIVAHFQDMAIAYAYSILQNFHASEDAVQEAFVEAFLNLTQLRQPESFAGWFRRIIFKQCDRITRKRKAIFTPIEVLEIEENIHSDWNPNDALEKKELRNEVFSYIYSLSKPEREAVLLYYISEYSQSEISHFLQVPIHTVKNKLRSARLKLKERMIAVVQDEISSHRKSANSLFSKKIKKMIQPEELKTNHFIPWSGGQGTDIWEMITSSILGDLQNVKKLLKKDANLSNCQWAYFTPIHFAVREGHIEVVKLLIDYGADATATTIPWQDSPLTKARDRGYHDIVQLLENHLKSEVNASPTGLIISQLIKERKLEQVKQIIQDSPEIVHASDERGNTPLHWAVLTRQMELIDYLLEHGAFMDAVRVDGATPVQLAIQGDYWYRAHRDLPSSAIQNQWYIVGYLISKGATYDIFIASAVGDTEQVEQFLQRDSSLIQQKDSSCRTALYYAAKFGHYQTLKKLLDYGANPNQAEKEAPQGSALHASVLGNHVECAKLLLEKGANVHATVEASGNSLSIAMSRGYKEIESLLYTYGATLTLSQASWLGRTDLVAAMLAVDPTLVNQEGDYGALCMATGFGHEELVHLLIKMGADLNQPWYANNYMGYAFDTGAKMVKLLLDNGADPSLANWLGVTYLHKLAVRGDIELAKIMIESGANINQVDDEYSSTPLGWAAKNGQKEMVQFLLKQGANPHLPLEAKWATPVEWAKRNGFKEIEQLLT